TKHHAPIVAIAGGLGSFEPRKPKLDKLEFYEERGVEYMVKNPEQFEGKDIIIAGGGDSALDWTIYLAEKAKSLTLIHRRNEFRGALDSVEKVQALKDAGKVELITPAEVVALHGEDKLEKITIKKADGDVFHKSCDYLIPLFGLAPKLGPLAD